MENRSDNENASDKVTWIQFLRQVNVSLTIWSYFFIVGLVTGAPTVIIPQLIKETNTTVVLEDKFYPWITSIGSYTSIPCNLILTLLSHFCGRKKTLLAISICTFSASVLLYYSRSPAHIFFSQMIYGVTGAGQMTVYGPILAEYSSTKYRGIFLTLKSATFFWGIWTANAIGIFTHYKFIGLLAVLCSSYCFSTGFFIPESPYWLAFKGKYDQCTETHRLLKGEDEKAEKELKDLINLQEELHVHDVKFRPIKQCILHYVEIIQLPDVYKPILLCLLVFLVYHISGKLVCAVYALEIMKEITDKESTAHIGVLVLDGFSVLGMYIGCGVSKVLKRRTILLVNSTIGTTFLFILSIYLCLVKLSVISQNSYIVITLLVVYSLAICCGPAILSTSIYGELLPVKARSFSIFCTSTLAMLYFATIIRVSPMMFSVFDIFGTFLFFSLCSTICIILTYKYLPETKDKSIYEIAALFKKDQPQVRSEDDPKNVQT